MRLAEIGGELHQPVGEHDVGILAAGGVLGRDRVEQAAGGEPDEARADRRLKLEELGQIAPGKRDRARRGERPRGADARRGLRIEAGGQKLRLAEDIAPHNARQPRGTTALDRRSVGGKLHLDQRLGCALARVFRAGKQVDAVGRLTRLEDRLAGRISAGAEPQARESPSDLRIAGLEEARGKKRFVVWGRHRLRRGYARLNVVPVSRSCASLTHGTPTRNIARQRCGGSVDGEAGGRESLFPT